jgi:hypothetical protein
MDETKLTASVVKPLAGVSAQIANAAPFRDAALPLMESIGGVKTAVLQAHLTPMSMAAVTAASHPIAMEAFDATKAAAAQSNVARPPQQGAAVPASAATASTAAASEGYVRLSVHSENGVLSVTGVHEVAGPLALPSTVPNGLVYEALLGGQQVGLGAATDAGLSRSFANANVTGPERYHRLTQRTSFDFFVRVPRAQLTTAAMPNLNIVLHRVSNAPDRLAPGVALQKQANIQVAEVSRLPGIALEKLAPGVRPQFDKLLIK